MIKHFKKMSFLGLLFSSFIHSFIPSNARKETTNNPRFRKIQRKSKRKQEVCDIVALPFTAKSIS